MNADVTHRVSDSRRVNKVIFGDCRDSMRRLIDDGVKVQMCVTSPPYWGLRDYGVHGQIGLEPSLHEFMANLLEVFSLVRELLADDGTLWVNMGDSYASGGRKSRDPGKSKRHRAFDGESYADGLRSNDPQGIKPKNLIGQPWRLAFALQESGWYLRQDIIWHKPNPMPESVTDRCTKSHEYLFLLAKSPCYYFDARAIAQPISEASIARLSQDVESQTGSARVPGKTNGNMKAVGPRFGGKKYGDDHSEQTRTKSGNEYKAGDGLANKRSVWTIATQAFSGAHFATFPEALVEPCILAGSRPGDIVLDPFFGSGTTGQVAQRLGRKWIGCELNQGYEALQSERTAQSAMILD